MVEIIDTHPPAEIIGLLNWLPDTSALAASIQGGREFYGWGRDRHLAADAVDVAIAKAMGKKFKADQHGVKRPQMKATQGSAKSITAFMPPTLRRRLNDGG